MNNIIIHNFGNLPLLELAWSGFGSYGNSIIKHCLQSEKPNTVESNIAPHVKYNLWESKFNFLEDPNDSITTLKMWIINACQDAVEKLNNKNYKFVVTESWAHVTRTGGYHLPHYHSGSTWSGIFYVKCDPDGGKNHLQVPYNLERKPGLDFINDRFSITPVAGNLILFPSMITHYAEPHLSSEPRIVIAFNAICI